MQLIKYDPIKDIAQLEKEMTSFFQNGWSLFPSINEASNMDMYEENGKLIAEVSLPGYKKKEVKVSTDNGLLEIAAEHEESKEKKNKRRYYFQESSRRYSRRVALPDGADTEAIDASFTNGVLRISMPIKPTKKPKVINVK